MARTKQKSLYVDVLTSDGYFSVTDVTGDFQSKMPVICALACHDGHSYRLQIVVNNSECVETSRLLSVYSQLDPRVRPLVIAFRYWAKVSTFICTVLVCLGSHLTMHWTIELTD